MRTLFLSLAIATFLGRSLYADEPKPIHADDIAILHRIAEREKLDAPPMAVTKGWPLKKGEVGVRFAAKTNDKHALTVVQNPQGRVVKLLGNGPLLSNDSLKDAAGLPELRVIRIDHNIPAPGSKAKLEDFDGSGFAAFASSKLEEVRIGHGFDDDGLIALASVKSLRSLDVCHSRATEKGLAALAKHPNLEEFRMSCQGRQGRITDQSMIVLATLPKLKRLSLAETFLTYENGLKHLSIGKGRMELISFKGSLVLPADVAKLKADLPEATIETSSPAEILAAPNSRGVLKWASPEGQAYLKTGEKK